MVARSTDKTSGPTPTGFARLAALGGLHPIVSGTLFALYRWLCGLDLAATCGSRASASVVASLLLFVPTWAAQRLAFRDSGGRANAKAILVAALAIYPSSFSRLLVTALGVLGAFHLTQRRKAPPPAPSCGGR
jgi:hypothetical protein